MKKPYFKRNGAAGMEPLALMQLVMETASTLAGNIAYEAVHGEDGDGLEEAPENTVYIALQLILVCEAVLAAYDEGLRERTLEDIRGRERRTADDDGLAGISIAALIDAVGRG